MTSQQLVAETEAPEIKEEYPFETKDMGGYTLRVLNCGARWGVYYYLDHEKMTGEQLDDAVYKRNRLVEEQLNCKLAVTTMDINSDANAICKEIHNNVSAGDDVYDVTYVNLATRPGLITEGAFVNLYDVDNLHLDSAWWDKSVGEQMTIKGSLYATTGAWSLYPLDGAQLLFFNEDMMKRNDLPMPYDAVRQGTWTVEKMLEYCKAIANLGGDSSFQWDPNGNATYGISIHDNMIDSMILGCNTFIIQQNGDSITLNSGDNHFVSTMEKLAAMINTASGYGIRGDYSGGDYEIGGYRAIFTHGRSLFMTGELKAAQMFRSEMDEMFGIVPMPKLDESQSSYLSSFYIDCLYYAIPTTNTHHAETGLISDVMSYYSMRDVLPVYYEVTVEQKGLRNEDSIEMLNIIRQSQIAKIGDVFGWTSNLTGQIRTKLLAGDYDLISTLEKQRNSIEKNIDKMLTAVEGIK